MSYLNGQAAYPVTKLFSIQTCRLQWLLYVAFQRARFTRPRCYHQGPWALTPRFHPHLYF